MAKETSLYVHIDPNASLKIGTCDHCVLHEPGRPERAWNPDGDKELDFDRDELLKQLESFGVVPEVTQQYVCP